LILIKTTFKLLKLYLEGILYGNVNLKIADLFLLYNLKCIFLIKYARIIFNGHIQPVMSNFNVFKPVVVI